MAEKQVPLPLSGEEVRNAIIYKVDESLRKTCNLSDSNAYSAFKGEISIRLTLSDFGREVSDNHNIVAAQGDLDGVPTETVAAGLIIPEAPPNQVRIDTHQDVPVQTKQDGKTVVKKVKYAPRKQQ